jgi:hypothetical protein
MAKQLQNIGQEDISELGTAPDVAAPVQAWLVYLKTERGLAAHTVEAYKRDLGQFLFFLGQHFGGAPDMPALLALSARDIRSFLAYRRSQNVGSRSLSRALSALRMFFQYLERRGYGKNDAVRAVSMPKLPHAVPKPLPEAKATALMEGSDLAVPEAPNWTLARDTAVLTLLYGSGLRISEALRLQVCDAPIKGRDTAKATKRASCPCYQSPARPSSGISIFAQKNLAPTIHSLSACGARGSAHGLYSCVLRRPVPRSDCRRPPRRMPSATRSRRTCWEQGPTCGQSKSCSGMQVFRPRKVIRRSTARIS